MVNRLDCLPEASGYIAEWSNRQLDSFISYRYRFESVSATIWDFGVMVARKDLAFKEGFRLPQILL